VSGHARARVVTTRAATARRSACGIRRARRAHALELTGCGAVETRSNWNGLNAGRREVAITAAMVRVREMAVSDTAGTQACAS